MVVGKPRARSASRERDFFIRPREAGEGTTRSVVEGASALRSASRPTPLPPPFGRSPFPASRGRISDRTICLNAAPGFRFGSIRATSSPMANFLSHGLVPIAIGAVTVVLLLGLTNMMRGGSGNTSQKLMRWRVLLQFIAIVIIMITIWAMGK